MAFTFIWDSGMFLHLVKYMYMHKTLHISLIKSIAIYVHIIWNNTAIGPFNFWSLTQMKQIIYYV